MICSELELGLSSNHEGILVLPSESRLGSPLSDALHSSDAFEIEITANEIVTGIKGCVDTFVDAVINDAPIAVTGEDAFASLAAACAADQAAATGRNQTPESL